MSCRKLRGLRPQGVTGYSYWAQHPASLNPAPEEEDTIVSKVTAAAPDFLFVAYGAPRQDIWIRRNLARLNVPVCVGIGGTLDFVAGVAKRAPRWMRQVGLEWLHRLIHQPWRWRRMLVLPKFAWLVLRQRIGPSAGEW